METYNKLNELRKKTGEGILVCLEALEKNNGDIEDSINWINTRKDYTYSEYRVLNELESAISIEEDDNENFVSVYSFLEILKKYYYEQKNVPKKYLYEYNNSYTIINIANSNFKIYLKKDDFKIFNMFPFFFLFQYSLTHGNNFSDNVKNGLTDYFKKLFINICDCPIWMQKKLYNVRKNQLLEEKKQKVRIKNK